MSLREIRPDDGSPSCHVCGAIMVPASKGYKCLSCGATTEPTGPAPSVVESRLSQPTEWKELPLASPPQIAQPVTMDKRDEALIDFHFPTTEPAAAQPLQVSAEQLAQRFHELYEELAPSFGYETRKESAKPWLEVPIKNQQLMTAVCKQILAEAALAATPLQLEIENVRHAFKQHGLKYSEEALWALLEDQVAPKPPILAESLAERLKAVYFGHHVNVKAQWEAVAAEAYASSSRAGKP